MAGDDHTASSKSCSIIGRTNEHKTESRPVCFSIYMDAATYVTCAMQIYLSPPERRLAMSMSAAQGIAATGATPKAPAQGASWGRCEPPQAEKPRRKIVDLVRTEAGFGLQVRFVLQCGILQLTRLCLFSSQESCSHRTSSWESRMLVTVNGRTNCIQV